MVLLGTHLKAKARRAVQISEYKREVEIDFDSVEKFCNTIYGELDVIVGKDAE